MNPKFPEAEQSNGLIQGHGIYIHIISFKIWRYEVIVFFLITLAYIIIQMEEFESNGKNVRLLKIRNPWGLLT